MLAAFCPATKQALGAPGIGLHVYENADEKVVRVTVHPAAEPRAALEYQLLPPFFDRTPGNAAVHYGKVTAEQRRFFGDTEMWEKIVKWLDTPLDELPRDEVRKVVRSEMIFGSLRRAARCKQCDWLLPVHEGNFFSMLLPEAQQMRSFARLVALKARLQIAEGEFDEAVRTLQMGYAMGRHIAEGDTLINGLVGIAICSIMARQVQELIQQPDAPNLYWALTMLPRPLVGMQAGIEAEMNAVYLTFPELRDADDTSRSPEYWRESLHQVWRKFATFGGGTEWAERPEVVAALSIKGYPMAKQALIAAGLPQEEVEAMPVSQVVLLYTRQTYEDLRDDVFKWFYVPFWLAHEGSDQAEARLKQYAMELREIIPVASLFLPAVRAAHSAIARNDREIAGLRTIEALRMYAAAHEGRLPEKLDDLSVPAPVDPVTGQPFTYTLRGQTAVLDGPPLLGILFHVEVKVAR